MMIVCRGLSTLVAVAALLLLSARPFAAQGAAQRSTAEPAAANVESGKRLYTKYGCYQCHGHEGQGSSLTGPRLGPNPASLASLVRYLRTPTGEMPPYSDKLVSDQELADIHAYLRALKAPAAVETIPLLRQ